MKFFTHNMGEALHFKSSLLHDGFSLCGDHMLGDYYHSALSGEVRGHLIQQGLLRHVEVAPGLFYWRYRPEALEVIRGLRLPTVVC